MIKSHSWTVKDEDSGYLAGIGRGEGDLRQLGKMASRPESSQRWRRAKALVIDEVSHFTPL